MNPLMNLNPLPMAPSFVFLLPSQLLLRVLRVISLKRSRIVPTALLALHNFTASAQRFKWKWSLRLRLVAEFATRVQVPLSYEPITAAFFS